MGPNPLLKWLGFAENDRVVIFHADDVGMCQATLSAFEELWDFGLVSSAAVMVPAPWFPGLTDVCRRRPELDVGVHVTLTSEWRSYRWSPISTRDPTSGLLDTDGYFHADEEALQTNGRAQAVHAEILAQVGRALAAGLDITHIDSHMGGVFHPKFLDGYIQAAMDHSLPPFLPRWDEPALCAYGFDVQTAAQFARQIALLDEQRLPMVDHFCSMPLDLPEDRLEQARQAVANLQPGVTHFIIHPAHDTPEMRAIAPDWRARVADYHIFTDESFRAFVRGAGVHAIGYRALRDIMRS